MPQDILHTKTFAGNISSSIITLITNAAILIQSWYALTVLSVDSVHFDPAGTEQSFVVPGKHLSRYWNWLQTELSIGEKVA